MAQLSAPLRAKLLAHAKMREFAAGEMYQEMGAPPEGVFVLIRGSACAYLLNAAGNSILLRIHRPGEVLNEAPSSDDLPVPVQGVVRTEAAMLCMPWENFQRLRAEHPELHLAAAIAATRRYRMALQLIEELGLLSVEDRTTVRLARLAEETAGREAKQRATALDITQAELAAMTNATRQTTNKVLAALAQSELVTLGFKEIVVQPRLVERAQLLRASELPASSRP